jgi:hypothetical protein
MNDQEKEVYFSHEALARFIAAQGKTLEKVICHLWQNKIDKNSTVEIIDNLELHFTDKQRLTISCNTDGDGLDAIEFDYESNAKQLQEEFDGRIKLFSVDASGTKMWVDAIGKTLEAIRITKDGENYKSDSVMLDFGAEQREVSISPVDGLIIDYYEA